VNPAIPVLSHLLFRPPLAPPTPSAPAPSPSGPGAGWVPGSGRGAIPAPEPTRWVLHAATWAMHRPWLLGVAAAALVGWVTARSLVEGWRQRRHATGARLVTIAPPPQVEASSAAISAVT
jgi:hypothetical protein